MVDTRSDFALSSANKLYYIVTNPSLVLRDLNPRQLLRGYLASWKSYLRVNFVINIVRCTRGLWRAHKREENISNWTRRIYHFCSFTGTRNPEIFCHYLSSTYVFSSISLNTILCVCSLTNVKLWNLYRVRKFKARGNSRKGSHNWYNISYVPFVIYIKNFILKNVIKEHLPDSKLTIKYRWHRDVYISSN